mgnify:FL=1|tara:strand:+ start:219 stop:572 length:354 start_codon:yes stop_codon:yes gene_type:complete
MDINLKDHIYFNIDHRSLPSGIGHIVFPNDDTILVTDEGCGPKDMSEAAQQIKEEFLPKSVSHIPFDISEHWEVGQAALSTILERYDVEYVYDSEMDSQYNDGNTTFTLDQWLEMRR